MSTQETGERNELMALLNGMIVVNRPDRWVWQGAKENVFSVKDVKKFLEKRKDYTNRYFMEWCNWVPKKCNVFVWRAAIDRIPTKGALKNRNCWNGDTSHALCGEGSETTKHIFCECEIFARVWHFISCWSKSAPFFVFDVSDILELYKQQGRGKTEAMVIKGIIITSVVLARCSGK
uniref:uncharacterized protein LOC122599462 n=1 Tax=Erigeron canadensis TaxID=72917 RepID=UPI001CB8FEFA|nr:uncharacterized protein LOC122599462 [Erigeron canadensis]